MKWSKRDDNYRSDCGRFRVFQSPRRHAGWILSDRGDRGRDGHPHLSYVDSAGAGFRRAEDIFSRGHINERK